MASLTRKQILDRARRPEKQAVDVPSLGGGVFVRMLSLGQLVQLQADSADLDASGKPHLSMIRVVTAAAVDEDGGALFKSEDEADLLELPTEALKTIADAAMRFNKIGDDAVEDARKN